MRQPESPASRVILDLLLLNLDDVRRWQPSEEPGLCSIPVQAWARAALQAFQRARGRNGACCIFECLGAALHGWLTHARTLTATQLQLRRLCSTRPAMTRRATSYKPTASSCARHSRKTDSERLRFAR